ncbi:MAG: anti-sigma factor [Geminicoccaceae bacterium]
MSERVSDAELQAFIDGQLDMAGRIEVERRLQADPEAAAAAIEGLRLRDELRLFLSEDGGWPTPAGTVGRARELSRRLRARRSGLRLRGAVAAALLIGAGWFAHAELGLFVDSVSASQVPAYATQAAVSFEALSAHEADAPAPSRLLGPAAPRTGGAVPLPELLDDRATLVATQAVKWEGGTGLAALYRTGEGRLVSLFAAEAPAFDVVWPSGALVDGHPTVFWQSGPYAYALSGGMAEAELLDLAQRAVPRPWTLFVQHPTNEGVPHG